MNSLSAIGIMRLRRALLSRIRSFTLIEILVVLAIFGIIFTALIVSLNTGQFSASVGYASVELQAKLRGIVNLITTDVRQTQDWKIRQYSHSDSHLEFSLVRSWKASNNTLSYRDDPDHTDPDVESYEHHIIYSYDSANKKITRTYYTLDEADSEVAGSRKTIEFYDVLVAPFYSSLDTGSTCLADDRNENGNNCSDTVLNTSDLLNNRNLFIKIKVRQNVIAAKYITSTLREEVKIRNE